MKHYDFKKAKRFIDEHKDEIKEASLGMHEDWFWTAETVFENGEYTTNLDADDLLIGGIKSSYWATPVLQIEYLDGRTEVYNCFTGESDGVNRTPFLQGCISERISNERAQMERSEIK